MTSTGTVSPFETIIGIDISKDRLDIAALPGRQHHSFANTPAGHARFIAWIARHAPGPFLVFEATGAIATSNRPLSGPGLPTQR